MTSGRDAVAGATPARGAGGASSPGTSRARLLAVARGDAEPDLVVEGGRVFSAFTREWLDGDVAIADGRIAGVGRYDGGERVDAAGRYVVPGLIDAHVHVESSKLLPAEFARVVVARGTTSVVCDPHELANVLGADGAHWMLDASSGLPLRVFVMAPSCVPASALESARGPLGADDMAGILRRGRALGVAEVMDFPSVIAGDPDVLAKVALHAHVDGHAPGVTGAALDAYAAAGIRSDHEATTWEEALEKRRRGLWVLLREASNARNLEALLELVRRHGPEHCAFCTDDREPDMLVREGHIDAMCRQAVAAGIAPEDALLMATLHPARCHGLADLGAIAPGFSADLAVLDDLASFRAAIVVAGGAVAARDGAALPFSAPPVPDWVRDTVRTAPLAGDAFDLGPAGERVRVIEMIPEQLITGAGEEAPAVRDGRVVADPARDLAKLAVIERHHATGRIGVGLVRGFGLRSGAFASTVAHDAHNLVVVGVDDASMRACAERLVELGGGIAVADGGAVLGELALPVAGLLSEEPAEAVVERLDELVALLRDQGVGGDAPFMTLSFLALSVIPELKLTDQGLVDVAAAQIVPLVV
jgi:adenine deaminase